MTSLLTKRDSAGTSSPRNVINDTFDKHTLNMHNTSHKRLKKQPELNRSQQSETTRMPVATASDRSNEEANDSPMSFIMSHSPPRDGHTKTPMKYPNAATCAASILDWIMDDAITALIFSFCGPVTTAKASQTCQAWSRVSRTHPSLWRHFVDQQFRLGLTAPSTSTSMHVPTTSMCPTKMTPYDENHRFLASKASSTASDNDATKGPIEWHRIYNYLALHHRHVPPTRLNARVVFADDGGNFPGYPAHHVLSPEPHWVWCTSTGVDKNVDLVIEFEHTSLITSFHLANAGRGYSAPVKEALVFVSMDPPDLATTAELYNDEPGRAWVQKLVLQEQDDECEASWASMPSIEDRANGAGRQEEESDEDHSEGFSMDSNNGEQHDVTMLLESPEQTSAARNAVPPLPSKKPSYLTRKVSMEAENTLSSSSSSAVLPPALTPVAAFYAPNLGFAYDARAELVLPKPVVGRYVHVKLLTSHSPPGLESISDNIDLRHFHTMGIPVDGSTNPRDMEEDDEGDDEDEEENEDEADADFGIMHETNKFKVNIPYDGGLQQFLLIPPRPRALSYKPLHPLSTVSRPQISLPHHRQNPLQVHHHHQPDEDHPEVLPRRLDNRPDVMGRQDLHQYHDQNDRAAGDPWMFNWHRE